MQLKKLNKELLLLKMMYEDAILNRATSEELQNILRRIEEVNQMISGMNRDGESKDSK